MINQAVIIVTFLAILLRIYVLALILTTSVKLGKRSQKKKDDLIKRLLSKC